jgi:hypothetical protein
MGKTEATTKVPDHFPHKKGSCAKKVESRSLAQQRCAVVTPGTQLHRPSSRSELVLSASNLRSLISPSSSLALPTSAGDHDRPVDAPPSIPRRLPSMSDHPFDVRSSPRRGVRRLPRDLPTTGDFGGLHNAVFPTFGAQHPNNTSSSTSCVLNPKPRVSADTLRLLLPLAKSQVAPDTGVISLTPQGAPPARKVDSAPRLVRPSDSLSHLSSLVSSSVRIRSSVGLSQLGQPSPHMPKSQR